MRRTTALVAVTALVAACVMLAAATVPISAQTAYRVTSEWPSSACASQDGYDEYVRAILHASKTGDVSWMKQLHGMKQCFRMKKGLRVTIKDYGFTTSQIYLHAEDGGIPLIAWTANENFMEQSGKGFSTENVMTVLMTVLIGGIVTVLMFAISETLGVVVGLILWIALILFVGGVWGLFGYISAVAIPAAGILAVLHYLTPKIPKTPKTRKLPLPG